MTYQALRVLIAVTAILCGTTEGLAFRVVDVTDSLGLGILRWDADPHFVDGVERSLDGGLRYSIEGGSYEAFRDKFVWADPAPTVAELQAAVEQAFADWEVLDPSTGLGTALYFVPDFNTPIDIIEPLPETLEGRRRLNPGAEIDITSWPDLGFSGTNEGFVDPNSNSVTLSSGIQDYGAAVYSGADIRMNTLSSGREPWPFDRFREVLSHEIGHAVGLTDVDLPGGFAGFVSPFYDDNFDDSNNATARETLTNSFANLVDPLDPNNSPGLMLVEPCSGGRIADPCTRGGFFDALGVDIHMDGSAANDNDQGPQNDDFAGRQFLYPYIRVPGDFNADKELTIQDVDLLLDELVKPAPRTWFDLTGDDVVDLDDRAAWVELRGTFVGDANLDGQVNAVDLNTLALSWGADNVTSWSQGDFNGDGIVNAIDLNDLALNWSSGIQASPVPEPSCIWLVAMAGLIMLIAPNGRTRMARLPHCRGTHSRR